MSAKEYHDMKTELCRQKGIELMYVWEKDFLEDPEGELDKIEKKINDLMSKSD